MQKVINSGRIDRREFFISLTLLLAFAYIWDQSLVSRSHSNFPYADLLGYAAAMWRISRAEPGPLPKWLIGTGMLLVGIGVLGPRHTPAMILTLVAVHLAFQRDLNLRAGGVILLALASHELWSKALFAAIGPEFVRLDAAMVGAVVKMTVESATWEGNIIATGSGHGIVVEEMCASFANVSLALLWWVTVTKFERPQFTRRDAFVALVVVITQVALNVARMYLMALSAPGYEFWHGPTGGQIYSVSSAVLAIVITLIGERWARKDGALAA